MSAYLPVAVLASFRLISSTITLAMDLSMLALGVYPYLWEGATAVVPEFAEVRVGRESCPARGCCADGFESRVTPPVFRHFPSLCGDPA